MNTEKHGAPDLLRTRRIRLGKQVVGQFGPSWRQLLSHASTQHSETGYSVHSGFSICFWDSPGAHLITNQRVITTIYSIAHFPIMPFLYPRRRVELLQGISSSISHDYVFSLISMWWGKWVSLCFPTLPDLISPWTWAQYAGGLNSTNLQHDRITPSPHEASSTGNWKTVSQPSHITPSLRVSIV